MTGAEAYSPPRDVVAYLTRLQELAQYAAERGDATEQAVLVAELQRLGMQALQFAVAHARQRGASWRDLAGALGIPVTTLRRQYAAGAMSAGHLFGAAQPVAAQPATRSRIRGPAGAAEPRLSVVPAAGLDQFVGRERELADLRPLLARQRMVTLTGPAGVGKTRLAVELIPHVRRAYPGGLWWVDLAPLPNEAPVPDAVAAAVGAGGSAHRGLGRTIANACATRPALLILDNCEHLAAGCAELAEKLTRDHRRLRVLSTSRETLGVRGEVVVPVSPLPVPAADAAWTELRQSAAVQLFLNRAYRMVPDHHLSDELDAIAQLCVRLDGLPLAIELAARQAGILPPARLLERLDERLTFLVGGTRDVPARHRSLRAAIEWSYDLLTKHERAVFRRLAVLPGGFDERGAAAVCADIDLPTCDLWSTQLRLAGKSMLVPDPVAPGRLRMLESLRAYAQQQLAEAGELDAAHDRLLTWLVKLGAPLLTDTIAASDVMAVLHDERHNLRYGVEVAERADDPRYAEVARTLAVYLRWRRQLRQAQALLESVLVRQPEASDEGVRVLTQLALVCGWRGDAVATRRYAEKAVALARRLDSPALVLNALRARVTAAGETPEALALIQQELDLARRIGPTRAVAMALNNLAWHLLMQDRCEEGQGAVDEALALFQAETRDDQSMITSVQHTAGTIAALRGDLERAEEYFATALCESVVDGDTLSYNLEGLALIAARRGQPERTIRLLAAACAARARIDTVPGPWWRCLLDDMAGAARAQLGAARAGAAWTTGSTLTDADAIAYALHDEWPGTRGAPGGGALSSREYQVVELVSQGLTNPQIAARIGVSARTVASHLESVRRKLELPTRAHVTIWASRRTADGPRG